MTRDATESVIFVVMEHASEWPSHIKGGAAGCVALRQQPNEDHLGLLLRAHEPVQAIERIGGCVERAVLSCNDDPSVDDGRVPLAGALLATVLRHDKGRLELVAGSSTSAHSRQSLMALASTLSGALAGTFASVSVRFQGRLRRSPREALAEIRAEG